MRSDIGSYSCGSDLANDATNGNADVSIHKVDVVIVGGGFSGCYLLHKLRQNNFTARIVEAAPGLGGVWQWNCYPGARVDTHVPLYEYSMEEVWKTWSWKEKFPTAAELQAYFEHVDKVLQLSRDVIYNTKVTQAAFNDSLNEWTISTDKGVRLQSRYFVPAVGFAAKRSFPDWPGLEDFTGVIHHSSFWPRQDVNLDGKRVAVVGTGSTGVQLVQELGPRAKHLTLFQRTPNLALPLNQVALTEEMQQEQKAGYPAKFAERLQSKGGYDFSPEDINTFDHTPEERKAFYQERWDKGGFLFWVGSYKDVLTNLKSNREAYDFWACQDNVQIIDVNKNPVTRVTSNGVVTADGEAHLIDALILATGFDAITGGLKAIDIKNGTGKTLSEKWSAGTWTNLGLMTADFPNMFLMYGPQGPTALSNGPTCVEIQGNWIVNALVHNREKGLEHMVPTHQAQEEYRAMVNDLTAQTLYPMAKSYYMGANIEGKTREALNFPAGIPKYKEMLDGCAARGYEGFVIQ
ncbi:hypothetical protein CEP52_001509 [Fusarium oligoseptatum]|uniref:FAD/NAD(P)-binding domain-containing protein n=1 Tax=Fusarium oligoseptatum TaxID=2604345 RepID=A0A428UJ03_9HYPO|nr:hypothetical protein CEP52_001509 [Fusarium oligoseptatum]